MDDSQVFLAGRKVNKHTRDATQRHQKNFGGLEFKGQKTI
jgi:hypothetical protein